MNGTQLRTPDPGHPRVARSVEDNGIARVWGVRILPSPVIAAGTAGMADWSSSRFHSFFEGVQVIWAETGTHTYEIESVPAEVELFSRNLVVVCAENRFGAAWTRPGEYEVCDLTA